MSTLPATSIKLEISFPLISKAIAPGSVKELPTSSNNGLSPINVIVVSIIEINPIFIGGVEEF